MSQDPSSDIPATVPVVDSNEAPSRSTGAETGSIEAISQPTYLPPSNPAEQAELVVQLAAGPEQTAAPEHIAAKVIPTIDPTLEHPLDPRSIKAERLGKLIAAGILSGLSLVVVIFVTFAWSSSRILLPLIWILGTCLLMTRAWWWPAKSYRHISYRIDQKALVIQRGVWWRSMTLVPRSRVQHTDVSQGPIERHFGLGTLIVHTAGTQFAAVPLTGLAHDTAMKIRDLLIDEPAGDDAV